MADEKKIDERDGELQRLRTENATLRGAVWALERQLEALRGPSLQTLPPGIVDPPIMPSAPGLPAWPGHGSNPFGPPSTSAPHGGNCACSQCCPPTYIGDRIWCGTSAGLQGLPEGVNLSIDCAPPPFYGTTWVGETKATYGGPPGAPLPSDLRFTASPGSH